MDYVVLQGLLRFQDSKYTRTPTLVKCGDCSRVCVGVSVGSMHDNELHYTW
ncbi:hypothetical protein RP20_CCG007302 [Aedes albopictus]|nr:hypothetical protein RP20_CCG007302 [Aedes albopictus]